MNEVQWRKVTRRMILHTLEWCIKQVSTPHLWQGMYQDPHDAN